MKMHTCSLSLDLCRRHAGRGGQLRSLCMAACMAGFVDATIHQHQLLWSWLGMIFFSLLVVL